MKTLEKSVPFFLLLLSLVVLAPGATPAEAQRRSAPTTTVKETPERVAAEMFEKKRSAEDAARKVTADFRLAPEDALRALRAGGYSSADLAVSAISGLGMRPGAAATTLKTLDVSADEVAGAMTRLRVTVGAIGTAFSTAGFSALEALGAFVRTDLASPEESFEQLLAVGYPASALGDAADQLGWKVDLGCIDPGGFPVPCGNLGGAGGNMGQVSVDPYDAGVAGEVVTIQSTNIPEVEVLFDGTPLQIVEASTTRIRARLPHTVTVAPLTLRRVADGVEGVLVESFEVMEPKEADPYADLDWEALADEAVDAALREADLWFTTARLNASYCTVQGSNAMATPGVVQGGSFSKLLDSSLRTLGAPSELAEAWQGAFQDALESWGEKLLIPGLPLFPSLMAVPTPHAAPVPNVPVPLASFASASVMELTPMGLTERLNDALPGADTPGGEAAIAHFSNELGTTFSTYLAAAMVMNVLGEGPVPTVANGAAVVGPVAGGSCFSPGQWLSLLPSGVHVDLPDIG